MNYIDLIIIVFVVLCVYLGVRRGLVISLFSMLRAVAAIPLSLFVGNTYYELIYNNYVRDIVVAEISKKAADSSQLADLVKNINAFTADFSALGVEKLDLSSLVSFDSVALAEYITDNILKNLLCEIIKISLIILTFLLFYVITSIIMHIAKKIRKKKKLPLRRTNSALGGVFGLVKAGALVFAFCALGDFACSVLSKDNSFVTTFNQSAVADYINQINPLI